MLRIREFSALYRQLHQRFQNSQHDPLMGMLYAAILAFPVAMFVVLFILFIMVAFVENTRDNILVLIVYFLFIGAAFILVSPVLLLLFLFTIPYLAVLPITAALATAGLIWLGYRLPNVLLSIWIAAWTATFYIAISMGALSA